jgi:tetratricopeptide (TPR) repeat protein
MYNYSLIQMDYVLSAQAYLDMNPRRAEYISTAYYLRGMIFLYHAEGLGRHEFAKEDFEAAIKVNPNNYAAFLELSRVYSSLNLKEPAIAILRSLENNELEKGLAEEVQADLKKLTGTPAPKPEPVPITAQNPVPDSAVGDTSRLGRIAISSRMWTDVYLAGKQVGTTPLTLELPEGEYTLEYRRDEMRKSVTYNVKANQTIATTVPLDVTVDINAVPWAEVTIEGSPVSLGQTPLGSIRLPVGATLVFRNPAFPEKRHTITESDRTIRIAFP